MPARSAGILLWRRAAGVLQVLLVHPGGPFWARKDVGAWSIPKGEYHDDEAPEGAALREFQEELGASPAGALVSLGDIVQLGGKRVTAFALQGDFAADALLSARFEMEWLPRSGRVQDFPEVDRAQWLPLDAARAKLIPAQAAFLERLERLLGSGNGAA